MAATSSALSGGRVAVPFEGSGQWNSFELIRRHYGIEVEHDRTLSIEVEGKKVSVEVFRGARGRRYAQHVDLDAREQLHAHGDRSLKLARDYTRQSLGRGRGWDRGGWER